MYWVLFLYQQQPVALREESVDRNKEAMKAYTNKLMSLSARRAWIEIIAPSGFDGGRLRRSPRGERG